MIENYKYKTESDASKFWYENQKISLREYQKDLLFYWSGEEDKAEYALSDKTPTYDSLPSIYTDGKFGSYSRISSPLVFNGKNFESLEKNLSLSFWVSANSINGYYTYFLKPKSTFTSLTAGDYSITIQVSGEISRQLSMTFKDGDTFTTLKNKLSFNLDPSVYGIEVDSEQTTESVLVIKSSVSGKSFSLSSGNNGTDILTLLDTSYISYGTLPTEETSLIKLSGADSSINISHVAADDNGATVSKLKFTYIQGETTKTTSVKWNNNGVSFDNVEVDIDSSVMYVFLNGELLKAVLISPIEKSAEEMTLTVNGTSDNTYSYEEIIIKSSLQHKESFTPATSQLTKYDTTKPYIDFHYSGANIYNNSLTSLTATCSDGIDLVLNYDGVFYYYSSGSWRKSDGTYSQSNDHYTFADYLSNFTFTGKDNLFIRAYFESDGDTEEYLTDLYFTLLEDSIYGDDSQTAAVLVGVNEFPDDKEIEINGKTLVIKTDQGTSTLTFDKNMTLSELVAYLKELYPEGIASIYADSADRLVLVSETKGDEAYIKASGDAADIIFGDTKTAQGTDQTKNTLESNYEKFISDVKEYASNDLIPIEIDDDQIRLYLQEAINLYKKYRNDELNTYKVQLSGSPEKGYEIPAVIEDQHDITDILFKPLFPIGFYTGEFDNDAEDVISLSLLNTMCGTGGMNYGQFYGKGFQTDYYISLMNIETMEQVLGLEPSWKIYNNRLFIFPNDVSKYSTVTIVYKAPIDPIKALRDPYIIQYVYGKIRMAQGEIRGQYGSQISVSSIQMQLNGDTMYERGKTAVQEAIEGMMKNQEPLGFFFR